MRRNQKCKIQRTVLKRPTMCFSSYKNCELKVELWWVKALERKKSKFFVTLTLSKGNFL